MKTIHDEWEEYWRIIKPDHYNQTQYDETRMAFLKAEAKRRLKDAEKVEDKDHEDKNRVIH